MTRWERELARKQWDREMSGKIKVCPSCGRGLPSTAFFRVRWESSNPICKSCLKDESPGGVVGSFRRRRDAFRKNGCHTWKGPLIVEECRNYHNSCGGCYSEDENKSPNCPRDMAPPVYKELLRGVSIILSVPRRSL